jgi:hypothetical protein
VLPELPRLVHQALQRRQEPDLVQMLLLTELRRSNRMLAWALVGALALAGASVAGLLTVLYGMHWRLLGP